MPNNKTIEITCIFLGLNNLKGEGQAIFEDKEKNSQSEVLFRYFRSVISFSLICLL